MDISCAASGKYLRQTKHGKRYWPEYQVWLQMKGRCLNPRNKRFKYYGGRGIKIDPRWVSSFEAFISDMGRRPKDGMTIERVNNDGNYEPSNVIWMDGKLQQRNRRNNKWFEYQGEKKLAVDWSKESNISYQTLKRRLLTYGWTIERALTTPVMIEKGRV